MAVIRKLTEVTPAYIFECVRFTHFFLLNFHLETAGERLGGVVHCDMLRSIDVAHRAAVGHLEGVRHHVAGWHVWVSSRESATYHVCLVFVVPVVLLGVGVIGQVWTELAFRMW